MLVDRIESQPRDMGSAPAQKQNLELPSESKSPACRCAMRETAERYGLIPSGVTSLRRYLAEEKREDRRLLVEEIVKKGR